MKAVVVLSLFGIVYAVPSPAPLDSASSASPDDIKILRYDNNNAGLGKYRFAFEQSDATRHEQQGELVKKGAEEYLSVKGSFTFIGNDGVTYTITYTADDNGFKPEIEQGPGGGVPDAVVASMLG